jgi:MGT family glycosyltransferase
MNPKRILFVAPFLFGHINQLVVLAQELAARGYQTGFASSEHFRQRITGAGVELLPWDPEPAITDARLLARRQTLWQRASREPSILRGEKWMFDDVADTYPAMRSTLAPIFREYKPELVVVDSAAIAALDLAEQARVPCIILAQFLGNHVKTSPRYPHYGTPFLMKMNFAQRLRNRAHPLIAALYFLTPYLRITRFRRQHGSYTSFDDLYYKKLMLVSTVFGVEIPRPVPPLIQMIGPILPRQIEPLSPALRQWLDDTSDGRPVAFMAFGTLATIEGWQAKALVEGLTDTKVLWALRKNQQAVLPPLPASFRVEELVPQQAVLAHPLVRALITHCGMNSVSEALYFRKPILGLPIFGDQHYNAARLCDLGVGLRLNKQRFDSAEVRRHLGTLMTDPAYAAAARRMSVVIRNTGGRNQAANLVETVLQAGISHLSPDTAYRT